MNIYADLGSVSHATMRNEDLIPRFLETLDELKEKLSLSIKPGEETETVTRVAAMDEWMGSMERRMEKDGYFDSEDADYDLEHLFEELNTWAPPYAYFGAHEGDGSDYGFWVSFDSLEDDSRYGEVLKVGDLSEVPDDYSGMVYHVNDHGNGTLYGYTDGEGEEIWSVV